MSVLLRGEKDGGGDVLKLPPIDPSIYVLAQPTLAPPRPNVIDEAVVLKPKFVKQSVLLLHHAVTIGDIKRVQSILFNDVNPNGVDYNGQSPLSVAVMRNNADMVKLLIQYGAVLANYREQKSAEDYLLSQGDHNPSARQLMAMLHRQNIFNHKNPLTGAKGQQQKAALGDARFRNAPVSRAKKKTKVVVHVSGLRPTSRRLVQAVSEGNLRVVREMLFSGIDPNNVYDARGWSLMDIASYGKRRKPTMIMLLMKFGATVPIHPPKKTNRGTSKRKKNKSKKVKKAGRIKLKRLQDAANRKQWETAEIHVQDRLNWEIYRRQYGLRGSWEQQMMIMDKTSATKPLDNDNPEDDFVELEPKKKMKDKVLQKSVTRTIRAALKYLKQSKDPEPLRMAVSDSLAIFKKLTTRTKKFVQKAKRMLREADADRELAAVIIQLRWKLQRAKRIDHGKRQHQAAIIIQARARGHLHRRHHRAAITLQTQARRFLARQVVQRRRTRYNQAATSMQRMYRGYAARTELPALREEVNQYHQTRRAAATQIQAQWRRFEHESDYQARRAAALRIQSYQRGYAARVTVSDLRAGVADNQRDAVVHVQRMGRGYLARKQLRKKREAATRTQALYRGYKQRQELGKRHLAATRVQACYRGSGVRKEMAERASQRARHDASVQLQAAWRGHSARKDHQQRQDEAAAAAQLTRARHDASVQLQAAWRGHSARKDHQQRQRARHDASVQLQAAWRGHSARKDHQQRQAELQRLAEAEAAEAIAREMAATKIQKVHRGRQGRQVALKQRALVSMENLQERVSVLVGIKKFLGKLHSAREKRRDIDARALAEAEKWEAEMATKLPGDIALHTRHPHHQVTKEDTYMYRLAAGIEDGELDQVRALLLKRYLSSYHNIEGSDAESFSIDRFFETEDFRGYTPLVLATLKPNNLDMMNLLLQFSADPTVAADESCSDGAGETPVIACAYSGDADMLRRLLQYCKENDLLEQVLDQPMHNEATPIYLAAQEGHLECVKVLIEFGADVEKTNAEGVSPLFAAVAHEHTAIVELLSSHTDVNKANEKSGTSPMLYAVQVLATGKMVRLLSKLRCDISQRNAQGVSAFEAAVSDGNIDIINTLLEQYREHDKKYPPKATDSKVTKINGATNHEPEFYGPPGSTPYLVNMRRKKDGSTMLMLALIRGHWEVARILYKAGADLHAVNKNEMDAHDVLYSLHDKDLMDVGLPDVEGLFISAEDDDAERMKVALDAGTDVNAVQEDGYTALMVCAHYGHAELVHLLLQHNASTTMKAPDGSTAFLLGCFGGSVDVVQSCLEATNKACANDKLPDGSTALMLAVQEAQPGIAKALLDADADVNMAKTHGVTPLYIATTPPAQPNMVKMLLQCKADHNTVVSTGSSVLCRAVHAESIPIVQQLLELKASPEAGAQPGTEGYGRMSNNPLCVAIGKDNADMVQLLLEAKADMVKMRIGAKGDPLPHFAARNGNKSALKQLCIALKNGTNGAGRGIDLKSLVNGDNETVAAVLSATQQYSLKDVLT